MLHRTARVVAFPASLDPRDRPEGLASPESLELQETPEPLASRRSPLVSQPRRRRASPAPRDLPDHQVLQDPQESLERLEPPDAQVQMLPQAHQDPVDHQDQPERLDPKDPQENQESPLSQRPLPPESQERLESQDPRDRPDLPDPQDPTDLQDRLARKDHLVPMELQDPTATQDPLVHLDRPEPPARKVSARNTAPPTEESSSRTERGDKHCKTDRSCASRIMATPVLLFYGYRFMLAMSSNLPHLWPLIFMPEASKSKNSIL